MNKIEAIIKPDKLTRVKDALAEIGLMGHNVAHLTGRGTQRGVSVGPRGVGTFSVEMPPKIKLELVVSDADTQKAIDTIIHKARTGNIRDRKIFVSPVVDARGGGQRRSVGLPPALARDPCGSCWI